MKFATLVPRVLRRSCLRKFLFVILLVAAMISGFGLYALDVVGTEVKADTHSDLEMVASLEVEGLSSWMDSYARTVRMLSAHETIRTGDPGAISEALERERDTLPAGVVAIHYVNLSGHGIVRSTDDVIETKSVPALGLSWTTGSLTMASPNEVAVSEVYRHDGGECPTFLSPVEGHDGVVMTVMGATKHAEIPSGLVERSQTRVATDTGVIAFDEYDRNVLMTYRDGAATPALDAAVDDETGVIEHKGDGDAGGDVVAYAPVSGTSWAALVGAPQTNAYAVAQVVEHDVAVLIGVALVGPASIGAVIGCNTVLSLRRLRTRAEALTGGDLDVDLRTYRVDELGALTKAFAEMRDGLRECIEVVEDARRDLARVAENYCETMGAATTGDLTVRTSVGSDDEAMATVSGDIDAVLSDLEVTVGRVASFAAAVDAAGERVATGTKEVSATSERVETATADISKGAAEQASLFVKVSAEMQDLSATVEEVAALADELTDLADDAAEHGEVDRDTSAAVHDEMANIDERVTTAAEGVKALHEEIADIEEVVDLIEGIAEQTDLLAFNASVEAARTGEADSSFTVAADEVKALAEKTTDATTDIESSIESVEGTADEAIAAVGAVRERVAQDSETVEADVAAIDEAVDRLEEVNHGVAAIGEATTSQVSAAQSVARPADGAVGITDETRDETTDTTGVAHERNDVMVIVAGQIRELSSAIDELQTLADRSEVREEGTRGGVADTVKLGDEDAETTLADGTNPESRSSTTIADLIANGLGGNESIGDGSDPGKHRTADDSPDEN